jgi:hypothetical protein
VTMHPFTERLALRIEDPRSETITDSLGDAGEIMRMWRFFDGDPGGSAVVGPFSEQTEFPWVQADDIERLKQALVVFVRGNPHHPQLCSAIFGLYYLAAPDTKSLLIEVLRDSLGRDSGALYQTTFTDLSRAPVSSRSNATKELLVSICHHYQNRPNAHNGPANGHPARPLNYHAHEESIPARRLQDRRRPRTP